jgi:hypothetical protein
VGSSGGTDRLLENVKLNGEDWLQDSGRSEKVN